MTKREERLRKRRETWLRNGFQNLLACLLLYLVVAPFLDHVPFASAIISVALTFVLVSAIGALSTGGQTVRIAVSLLVVTLIILWLETLDIWSPRIHVTSVLLVLFYGILAYSFARRLFSVSRVDANLLCAALCLYLIVGLLWGAIYVVLESVQPGSFAGALIAASDSPEEIQHHLQYLSYVTLSTLGFGDITPQTRGAAALCQTEAVVGQFLTVVLVARLVGLQVAQETNKTSQSS